MSLRLFAALAPSEAIADRLAALQSQMLLGARWRPFENFHLTLRFFDSVQEPIAAELDEALAEVALRTPPIEVQLKGVDVFGGAEPHTLYAGAVLSPPLAKLAADCERAARRVGLKPDTRKFTPHITLAYLTRAVEIGELQRFLAAYALFEPPAFIVAEAGLYSSWIKKNAPSQYRLEASYPLEG